MYNRHTQVNQSAEIGEGSPTVEQSGTQTEARTMPSTLNFFFLFDYKVDSCSNPTFYSNRTVCQLNDIRFKSYRRRAALPPSVMQNKFCTRNKP